MSLILDLHIIQNFPASCLNRDENGMPKTAFFGGRERSRISSQCQKAAIRKFMRRMGSDISVRSRGIPSKMSDMLVALGHADVVSVEKAIEGALKVVGIPLSEEREGMNTEHAFSLSEDEIGRFVKVIHEHFAELSAVEIPEEEDPKSRKRNNKKAKVEVSPEVGKKLKEVFDKAGAGHKAVDNLLFGRMVAENKTLNIEAASQFAHVISTHEVDQDLDFFTAGDDLGLASSDMMDTRGFTAPCTYKYANLHLDPFFARLNGRATAEFENFLTAFVKALPSGGMNSFAAHSPADFVMGVVRVGWPWTFHNAFIPPVKGDDVVRKSIQALADYFDRLTGAYGKAETKAAFHFTTFRDVEVPGSVLTTGFDDWKTRLWETVSPAGPAA